MIPVTVLTGFLGSGKTTLLSRLLATPGFARTAVIVNEFGEIGLDHDLVEAGDETVVALTNGCLCCRVQTDLSRTLGVLRARREAGEIDFDRVVVETSGLADPAPILHALATDPQVAEAFAIERVVATVDVATAGGTFARYAEARRQVAMADLVLLTKADLAPDAAAGLGPLLDGLNRLAPRLDARGRDAVDWPGGPADRAGIDAATLQAAAGHGGPHAVHEHDYSTVCILREKPVPAAAMLLFLEGIQTHEGSRLLRLKGLVGIAEMPDRPMVVHGVQHVFHQPAWLDRWPSDDRRTRIVMIGHGLSARWSSLLLEALEAEVEALRHRTEA